MLLFLLMLYLISNPCETGLYRLRSKKTLMNVCNSKYVFVLILCLVFMIMKTLTIFGHQQSSTGHENENSSSMTPQHKQTSTEHKSVCIRTLGLMHDVVSDFRNPLYLYIAIRGK